MTAHELLTNTWTTTLVFFILFIFARMLGKTQLGQLTFYEYISGITLGSIAGTIIASELENFWSHCYDLFLFFLLTYLLSVITIKSRPIRKVIEGSPTLIIENGRILEDSMGRMRYDLDELNAQLREQGILDPTEIQYGIMETTGKLSLIKKSDFQSVNRSDLNIHTPEALLPTEIIMDGAVIEGNLKKCNLSIQWLQDELLKLDIHNVKDVTYAVIDSKGNLSVNPKASSPPQTGR